MNNTQPVIPGKPTPKMRAGVRYGRAALAAYRAATGKRREPDADIAKELLADVLHLIEAQGVNPTEIIVQAQHEFEAAHTTI